MLVLVTLREMQPEPDRHECRRGEEERRHRIAPDNETSRGTDEGRQGKVCARARRAE